MKHSIFRLCLQVLFACVAVNVFSIPAHSGRRKVLMPDGTIREAVVRGDERCHWLESLTGHQLTSPVSSVPTPRYTDSQRHEISQRLCARRGADSQSSMLIDGCFPTTGKRKLLAVLVNFADTRPSYTQQDFSNMMNQENYGGIGSFRDYYLQQSYGQLDIATTVTRWVTLTNKKSMYSGDYVTNLIHEALKAIDAEIDFRDYDNDGDGILDGLVIIHQGYGQEASGNNDDIWSHSSTLYGMQFDGVTIYRYTIEPESYLDPQTYTSVQSSIGVVCHEFGHNLGASDYYDTNYAIDGEYPGTGAWDLMGSGAWNGPDSRGEAPAPFTAWQKVQFGWMEPIVLDKTQLHSDVPAVGTAPQCYLMPTTVNGDYYIIENRQKTTPWDTYTPGHGLLVTHVVESIIRSKLSTNEINAAWPQGFYTVCASSGTDPVEGDPKSYGNPNTTTATFPGTARHTEFSDNTLPSCHSFDGRLAYVSLSQIVEQDGVLSFGFVKGDAPQPPLNFRATVKQGVVHLAWDFPEDIEQPAYFTLWRDGEEILQTTAHSYIDESSSLNNRQTYRIDATYTTGLRSSYVEATVRVPLNKASELTATPAADGGSIVVSWKQPSELSRCVDDQHYEVVDHITSNFRYAHRYRPVDLLPYVGYKVRGISFIPNQLSAFAAFSVCVWRATPGSREGELIASRNVTEFSPTYRRTVLLTQQPVIEAGYEYWIGVSITSNNNSASVITDQTELIDGYGNWMSMGGTAWQSDPGAHGNYILSATLQSSGSVFTSQPLPETTAVNPDIDLYYPLAYRLYVDNHEVTTTTLTACTLNNDGAEHTYSLTSLYAGNNESRPLVLLPTGLTTPIPTSCERTPVTYDLQGRRVANPCQRGIYLQSHKKTLKNSR